MLAAALALLVAAASASSGPFDGRYALKGTPGQCARKMDEADSYAMFKATRFDQYEAHCEWGRLTSAGPGVWTARGACSVEGDQTPGAFRFVLKADALAMRGPDGITSEFRRCPTR